MAIRPFLAMTALEIREKQDLPENFAWMACHFSPYTRGLSNLPRQLPQNAMVIVNDFTPMQGHDPGVIAEQLLGLECAGILLDFQRPDCRDTAALAAHLANTLPCPVIVSECYANPLDCPVFLPPVPPSAPVGAFLSPWQGREVWLELALGGEIITLTQEGAQVTPLPSGLEDGFAEETLHCHYHVELEEDKAVFSLWRTWEDWERLLEEAENWGVRAAVGLYQELNSCAAFRTK